MGRPLYGTRSVAKKYTYHSISSVLIVSTFVVSIPEAQQSIVQYLSQAMANVGHSLKNVIVVGGSYVGRVCLSNLHIIPLLTMCHMLKYGIGRCTGIGTSDTVHP